MKWELTLYNPKEKITMTIEAEDADEARMVAIKEKNSRKASTYELELIE
jgi:hypothetical protein